jgi:glycerol-3-phosphate dehydrogenase (NAD(P)+)
MTHIGIVGAGAWGTTLALVLGRAGKRPVLWAYEPEVANEIDAAHRNSRYLPGIDLPAIIAATRDLGAAVADSDAVLLVAPAQTLRGLCRQARPHWRAGVPALICAKGVEIESLATLAEMVAEEVPQAPIAILSGPTFASEVARGLPTAVTLACEDENLGLALVKMIGTATFRPYYTDDVVGAELGGAVKNVLAVACGVVEGRGLGDNARAALITRGLAELTRLAVAKGARAETCMGLSGLGDLILTASSRQSRNYSFGMAVGGGLTPEQAQAKSRGVIEGIATAASIAKLARRLSVEMPICFAVEGLLYRGVSLDDTIGGLLARPFRAETGAASLA